MHALHVRLSLGSLWLKLSYLPISTNLRQKGSVRIHFRNPRMLRNGNPLIIFSWSNGKRRGSRALAPNDDNDDDDDVAQLMVAILQLIPGLDLHLRSLIFDIHVMVS